MSLSRALLFLFLFISCYQPNAQVDNKMQGNLKYLIEKEARIDKKKVPGIIISIITNDSVHVFSFGSKYKDSIVALRNESVFELGDISKMFLTYLCLDLEKKGKIALDSSLEKYLPPVYHNPSLSKLSILDYLIYRTPFPRLPQNIGLTQISVNQPYEHYSKDDLIQFYNSYKLPEKYSSDYNYNHTNFLIIQQMLENITGQAINKLIEDFYVNVLGLNGLGFYLQQPGQVIKGYTLSKQLNKDVIQYGIFNGSLGLCSDIITLSRFIQLLINDKLYYPDNPKIKEQEKIIPTKLSKDTYSGIGWHLIKSNRGNYILANIGASSSSRAFCGFIPDKNIGIVIFSNSQIGINGLDFMVLNYLNAKF